MRCGIFFFFSPSPPAVFGCGLKRHVTQLPAISRVLPLTRSRVPGVESLSPTQTQAGAAAAYLRLCRCAFIAPQHPLLLAQSASAQPKVSLRHLYITFPPPIGRAGLQPGTTNGAERADLGGGARAAQTCCAASRRRGGKFFFVLPCLCDSLCLRVCMSVCVSLLTSKYSDSPVGLCSRGKLGQTGARRSLSKRIHPKDQTPWCVSPRVSFPALRECLSGKGFPV